MTRVLNIGSINIDHVYGVMHFVRPGETLNSQSYQTFAGGKGFNQSVALARAGVATLHAGMIGKDATWLLKQLEQEGVDTTHVGVCDVATGHAMIQVDPGGENAIVLHAGANRRITEASVSNALSSCTAGDFLLLQNETNAVAPAIRKAHDRGLRVVFNPAPMTADVHHYPLGLVDIFVLNEIEAEALTGKTEPIDVHARMRELFPDAATVLTQGSKGATYFDVDAIHHEPALPVGATDTTAAGDTFIGFFLAELIRTGDPAKALATGCRAAAICVTRAGASDSIPSRHEVESFQVITPRD